MSDPRALGYACGHEIIWRRDGNLGYCPTCRMFRTRPPTVAGDEAREKRRERLRAQMEAADELSRLAGKPVVLSDSAEPRCEECGTTFDVAPFPLDKGMSAMICGACLTKNLAFDEPRCVLRHDANCAQSRNENTRRFTPEEIASARATIAFDESLSAGERACEELTVNGEPSGKRRGEEPCPPSAASDKPREDLLVRGIPAHASEVIRAALAEVARLEVDPPALEYGALKDLCQRWEYLTPTLADAQYLAALAIIEAIRLAREGK